MNVLSCLNTYQKSAQQKNVKINVPEYGEGRCLQRINFGPNQWQLSVGVETGRAAFQSSQHVSCI